MDPWTRVLSTPVSAGGVVMPNRLVAQPMERSAATLAGDFTPGLVNDYEALAAGGWGMVVIEAMTVCRDWKSRKGQLVIDESKENIITRFLSRMHEIAPGTTFVLQLTFPGVVAGEGLRKSTVIPAVHEQDSSIVLLDDGMIMEIQDAFKVAIDVSIRAGADGIDIKACHGYLGAEFLRPANTRPGPYGGSLDHRTRFMRELFDHARQALDDAGKSGRFLLGSRVSAWEGIKGGFGTPGPDEVIEDLAEPAALAAAMRTWGARYINVTAGIPAILPEITRPSRTAPWGTWNHFRLAKEIKTSLDATGGGMLVIGSAYSRAGGLDALLQGARNVDTGKVDMIGFGRQVLADPRFAKKVLSENTKDVRACTGCNQCATLLKAQRHVGCAYHDIAFKTKDEGS